MENNPNPADEVDNPPPKKEGDKPKEPTTWEKNIPWYLTIASSIALVAIGIFLIANIQWFKNHVFEGVARDNLSYKIHAYHLHLAMIKRSVGLFSGFALMFIGTAVAFYTLKRQTTLDMQGGSGFTAKLATASPGIVAMLLGSWLIVKTIESKDTFPGFEDQNGQFEQFDDNDVVTTPGRVGMGAGSGMKGKQEKTTEKNETKNTGQSLNTPGRR